MIFAAYAKVIRYLKIEVQWRFCLLIVVLLVSVINLQNDILRKQGVQTAIVLEHLDLIERIPDLEDEILNRDFYAEKVRKEQAEEKRRRAEEAKRLEEEKRLRVALEDQLPIHEPVLEGISINGESISVLIDGAIYEKGQKIEDYLIQDVTPTKVILEHTGTKEKKILQFADSEESLGIKKE